LQELKAAAQDGEPSAQYAMGARFATGEGPLAQDYAAAARWFTLAAKKGYAPAPRHARRLLLVRPRLTQGLEASVFLSVLARDGNDEISKDRVDSLVAQLNRDEMLQVQQLSAGLVSQAQPFFAGNGCCHRHTLKAWPPSQSRWTAGRLASPLLISIPRCHPVE